MYFHSKIMPIPSILSVTFLFFILPFFSSIPTFPSFPSLSPFLHPYLPIYLPTSLSSSFPPYPSASFPLLPLTIPWSPRQLWATGGLVSLSSLSPSCLTLPSLCLTLLPPSSSASSSLPSPLLPSFSPFYFPLFPLSFSFLATSHIFLTISSSSHFPSF